MKKRVQLPEMEKLALYPDLGGTRYSFTREILPDKLTYSLHSQGRTTRLEFPSEGSFAGVSIEDGTNGRSVEVFYEYPGEMVGARIWYRRYCDQPAFNTLAHPDKNARKAYQSFKQNETDLVMNVDLYSNRVLFTHCRVMTNGNISVISQGQAPLPRNMMIKKFEFNLREGEETLHTGMCVGFSDNVLKLGINPNPSSLATTSLSAYINLKDFEASASPEVIRRILESVFF